MEQKRKCGIIGVGAVGASVAYSIIFGCDGLINELVLIDTDKKKAEAEAIDLSHALPFSVSSHSDVYSGDYNDLSDADIIVITAGRAQNNGSVSRRELTSDNLSVTREIIGNINRVNQHAIIIIATNPVDIMTYAAVYYSGRNRRQIIGTGCVLDTARIKYELGKRFSVNSEDINMFICGEHGDSEFPLWSGANISGINLLDFCRYACEDCSKRELDILFAKVRDSAYGIIDGKGATSFGIGAATARIVSVILKDENSVLPVSVLLRGEYGISGVAISVPCIVGSNGIKHIVEVPMYDEEKKRLRESAQTLDEIIANSELSEAVYAYKTEFII